MKLPFSIFSLVAAGLLSAIVRADAPVNVTQYHNDSARDGLYVDSAFTQSAAANLTRDLNFDGTIVGNVYTQPLRQPPPTSTLSGGGFLTNLYAYYKMDDTSGGATDSSVNSRNMDVSGTLGSAPGKINTARVWTGGFTGPYLGFFGDTSAFQPGANPFFVTCWVKSATTTYGYDAGIAGKFVTPNASWLLYRSSDGNSIRPKNWSFLVTSDGTTGTTVSGPQQTDTNWHFLAAGWDGVNLKISVDNSTFTTTPFAGPVFGNGTGAFQIGTEAASNLWNGLIDEMGIWVGRDLTNAEVSRLYNGGAGLPFSSFGSTPPTDFNRDGHPDYLLYNAGTRQTTVWYLNNNVYIGGAYAPTLPVGWRVIDVADFNRDGHPDYALFNASTRRTAIWYLLGVTFIGGAYGPTLPPGWELVATGDFNNDGKPDYVLYNASTHQTAIWYLNNNVFAGGAFGPTLPGAWRVVGVADFNGNGKLDYLLFNPGTHRTAIWYLSGVTMVGGAFGPTLPSAWTLVGVGDFNGDGKPDYVLYNASTRQTAIWYLNNNLFVSGAFGPTLPPGWSLVAQ